MRLIGTENDNMRLADPVSGPWFRKKISGQPL